MQLSFALNLWAPHQPRLPLAKLTGDEMQEAVAAHNMQLVAMPPATPDRAALWYHGDTHVLAAHGDIKELTLSLDGRAEQGLAMAEAAAIRLPDGVQAADIALYQSQYRLALNLNVKVQKDKTYTFTKFVAASREDWGGDAKPISPWRSARAPPVSMSFSTSTAPPGASYGNPTSRSTAIQGRKPPCIRISTICLQPRPPTRTGRWAPAG